MIRIDFKLGFRIEQRISYLFRSVVEELVKNGEVNIISKYKSLNKHKIVGDFRFVVIEKILANSHNLSFYERLVMQMYRYLKRLSLNEERGFGLDLSFVTVEKVPLMLSDPDELEMRRIS